MDASVARGWISQIELQKGNVSLDLLDRLATALEIPIGDLLAPPEPGATKPEPLPNGRKLGDRRH